MCCQWGAHQAHCAATHVRLHAAYGKAAYEEEPPGPGFAWVHQTKHMHRKQYHQLPLLEVERLPTGKRRHMHLKHTCSCLLLPERLFQHHRNLHPYQPLQIKTVVDLRGRAERASKRKDIPKGKDSVGPPPVLNPQQVSALGAAQGDQIQGQPQASSSRGGGDDGPEPTADTMGAAGPDLDFAVTKLKHQGSSAASLESMSEDENGNGNGVKRSGNTEEMAAALVSVMNFTLEG